MAIEILQLFGGVLAVGIFIFLYTGKLKDNVIFNSGIILAGLAFIIYTCLKEPEPSIRPIVSSLFLLIGLALVFRNRVLPHFQKK